MKRKALAKKTLVIHKDPAFSSKDAVDSYEIVFTVIQRKSWFCNLLSIEYECDIEV